MKLLAHLTKIDGVRKEQSLKEHCFHTAEYAAESIGEPGLYHTAYLAGLLHDAGKARQGYVEYLENAYEGREVVRGSVNHTFAAVVLLLEKYHAENSSVWEKMTCEIICFAMGSHHGMFDCVDLDRNNGFVHRLKKNRDELDYDRVLRNYFEQVAEENRIEEYFRKAVQEIMAFFQMSKDTYKEYREVFFQISMLSRLVLSAVIYGDRRDTSEFMNDTSGIRMEKTDWKEKRAYYEEKTAKFSLSTPLNLVRHNISMQCLETAEKKSGIFRLNVPTGGGKTLSALRYALAHAEKYNKKRIIFVIPLLSVLDQNVRVIRDYLPDQSEILEHHSNVIRERGMEEEADLYEFLGESWNYPVVVSTMTQLLDILFAYRTSVVGRMQALCDSVIVIDEVQSLPKKITDMFNMAMNFLSQFCHASIVLSSATQPCFEELKWPLHFSREPDIVYLNKEQLRVFQRAEIVDKTDTYGMDQMECARFCADRLAEHLSLLLICNTKAEARNLFENLRGRAEYEEWDVFHLSTSMCQEHRLLVLEQIREGLEKVQNPGTESVRKVLCVSTQLIEAGVDLSFECVVRVLAGIDNLAQAAGRCNRSNEYGSSGRVYLIKLKNENLGMLHEIKSAQDCTRKITELRDSEEESLIGENATRRFYRYLYEEMKKEIRYPVKDHGTIYYLADLLSNCNGKTETEENKSYVLRQPFKTVGQMFQVFDQNTIDVLVPYGQGRQIQKKLEAMSQVRFDLGKCRRMIQKAASYTVSIYEYQRRKLEKAGMLHSILDGRMLILDEQAYDDVFGLSMEAEWSAADFIV